MSNVEQWEHNEQRAMETEITTLREQVEKLTKERDDLRSRRCEVCGYLEHEREHTGCLREQLATLAEQNEKMRAFVTKISEQTPEKPDHWSSCGQCEHNSSNAEDLLELPDLATPVLNKYRAEGMRMAAEICETTFAHGILQLGHRAAISKAIRAKADELEAGVK